MQKQIQDIQIPKLNVKREKQKMTKEQKRELISYTVVLSSFAILLYMLYLITDFYIKNHTFTWQNPVILRTPLEIKVKETLKKESTIQIKQVEAMDKEPFCFDVQSCIRDVGEELGFSNEDIMIAMAISEAESGYRADALNINKNGTADVGCMQINDVHSKRISREDRMNYEKNIRFAYQLRKEQGSWNAWSTCHNGMVNCSIK